jgi:nucleoside-diphosphate-sugar epimerase
VKILITGGLGFIGSHLVAEFGHKHSVDIQDAFSQEYMSYKMIHRGSQGLQPINEIERKHREANLQYRLNLIKGKFKNLHRWWTFKQLPKESYDLIINCGSLSEAILSQYIPHFSRDSVFVGTKQIKQQFPHTPLLHISSSMVYGTWEGLIDEQYSLGSDNPYGVNKIKAEEVCDMNDVILRPIHVYGIGDSKFPIWMNIERQIAINKPVLVEEAGCIYIDDFVYTVKNIVDKWNPGTYNISYTFRRSAEALKAVYPKPFETQTKLGPTGKPRGLLNCDKLIKTFGVGFEYQTYEETVRDYYRRYEDIC